MEKWERGIRNFDQSQHRKSRKAREHEFSNTVDNDGELVFNTDEIIVRSAERDQIKRKENREKYKLSMGKGKFMIKKKVLKVLKKRSIIGYGRI